MARESHTSPKQHRIQKRRPKTMHGQPPNQFAFRESMNTGDTRYGRTKRPKRMRG